MFGMVLMWTLGMFVKTRPRDDPYLVVMSVTKWCNDKYWYTRVIDLNLVVSILRDSGDSGSITNLEYKILHKHEWV